MLWAFPAAPREESTPTKNPPPPSSCLEPCCPVGFAWSASYSALLAPTQSLLNRGLALPPGRQHGEGQSGQGLLREVWL